jgi:hypothetical protein
MQDPYVFFHLVDSQKKVDGVAPLALSTEKDPRTQGLIAPPQVNPIPAVQVKQ